ncbi:hypothetical protein [Niveibacterium sp. SC-1]|uniref:PKD domain-containing protein n=1 Tax=Niveibacterium sp. SC-1 TaxID=3135646 RepID=UPI00311DBEA9
MSAATLKLRKPLSWFLVAVFGVFLAACGGGTDDDIIPDTITIQSFDGPETVKQGDAVSERAVVVRTGNINNSDLAYSWAQQSGPAVLNLAGADTSTITFTAPPVAATTAVVFKVTVTGRGHTEFKDRTVTIQP